MGREKKKKKQRDWWMILSKFFENSEMVSRLPISLITFIKYLIDDLIHYRVIFFYKPEYS